MEQPLTKSQLYDGLHQVKAALDYYKKEQQKNIVFFDDKSCYHFLSGLYCENGKTIGTILQELESCIPFPLTDDSFLVCLAQYREEHPENVEQFKQNFLESCKRDFIFHLLYISEEEQWQGLLSTCESLRQQDRCCF